MSLEMYAEDTKMRDVTVEHAETDDQGGGARETRDDDPSMTGSAAR